MGEIGLTTNALRSTPPVEPLADGAIDVYLAPIGNTLTHAQRQRCEALLDADERARLLRFRIATVRDQYLGSRALTRSVLSRYTGIAPEAWRFGANAHGRPFLRSPVDQHTAALRFNLSHSGRWIALGITRGRQLGLDIEYRKRANRVLAIAERFFSDTEYQSLMRLPQARRAERFFVYWTLKEAYIKARGMGLALPLGGFSFDTDTSTRIAVRFHDAIDDDPSCWQFFLQGIDEDHQMALCVAAHPNPLTVRVRRTDPLLDAVL